MAQNIITMFVLAAVMVALSFLNGCSRQETQAARSMEQIYEEDGLPVQVDTLRHNQFTQHLSFYGRLSGIKEATKSTVLGGKIEKVNARVGENVRRGQVIVEMDTTNPSAQYEQAKTAFENAERNYIRMKAMLKAGETSQSAFDAAETQYLLSKRNFETQRQMLFIDSPFDGIIVDLKVRPGDNVFGDANLFTIAQLNKMRTKVWATESEILNIKNGTKATATFNNRTYVGKVVEVAMAADPYKQAFYVDIEFDNPGYNLKSGVLVNIDLLIYENSNAIIVPRNLVSRDTKGSFVYVYEDGISKKRYITNGNASGIDYEVKSGLQAGDILITHGAAMVDDGRRVRIVE